MKIHIVAAALPPQLDGIGDYSAQVAAELARTQDVTVLTGTSTPDPIPGVRIETVFSPDTPSSVRGIAEYVETNPPDWVLLQYNPFSYGRWGLNLHLPEMLHTLKKRCPQTKFALMAHETFIAASSWQTALMSAWQRWQFWRLTQSANALFFSMDFHVKGYQYKLPKTAVVHLPVGSNIPRIPISRQEARTRLNINEQAIVLGLFGTMHVSRMMDWVGYAAQAVHASGQEVQVLYLGPQKTQVRNALGTIPVIADGFLSTEETSMRFQAMDICLCPLSDGVSTRRTTLMTALQHEIATVGTLGYNTDCILRAKNEQAFLLADVDKPKQFEEYVVNLSQQPKLRVALTVEGKTLFEQNFTWPKISALVMETLNAA